MSDLTFATDSKPHSTDTTTSKGARRKEDTGSKVTVSESYLKSLQTELAKARKHSKQQYDLIAKCSLSEAKNEQKIAELTQMYEKLSQMYKKEKRDNTNLHKQLLSNSDDSETIRTLIKVQDDLRKENDTWKKQCELEMSNKKSLQQVIRNERAEKTRLNAEKIMLNDENIALQLTLDETNVDFLKKEAQFLRDEYRKAYFQLHGNLRGLKEYVVCDSAGNMKQKK